jgi:hypothetical protein
MNSIKTINFEFQLIHKICVEIYHRICDNVKMSKNITLSIDDELLVFAKSLASKQSKSLSKYIADHFKEIKETEEQSSEALKRYQSRKDLFHSGGKRTWTRDELYER